MAALRQFRKQAFAVGHDQYVKRFISFDVLVYQRLRRTLFLKSRACRETLPFLGRGSSQLKVGQPLVNHAERL